MGTKMDPRDRSKKVFATSLWSWYAYDWDAFELRCWRMAKFQGPLSNGGVSRSRLALLCLSFFVLFETFPIFLGFSRIARGWSGIFPICPFPLSRPIKSTYEEKSRKGLRHNLDLSR